MCDLRRLALQLRKSPKDVIITAAIKRGFNPDDIGVEDIYRRFKETGYIPEFVDDFCERVIRGLIPTVRPKECNEEPQGTTPRPQSGIRCSKPQVVPQVHEPSSPRRKEAVMLPDVTRDSCTDAASRLGLRYMEELFFNAAVDAGYERREAADRAQALHRVWVRDGERYLPTWTRDYVLRICEGGR